jgi:hypothetical protein
MNCNIIFKFRPEANFVNGNMFTGFKKAVLRVCSPTSLSFCLLDLLSVANAHRMRSSRFRLLSANFRSASPVVPLLKNGVQHRVTRAASGSDAAVTTRAE